MKIRLIFAWYDFWIGAFYNVEKQILYFFPIPMFGIKLTFFNKVKNACPKCGADMNTDFSTFGNCSNCEYRL